MSSQTATQTATEKLRTLVLDGGLEPGLRLQERQLAATLGVSRTPVRDSLQALAGEGLLDYSPRSGYTVRSFGLTEVLDAFDARLALEGMACRTVAARGLPAETAQALDDNLERSAAILDADDGSDDVSTRWYETNLEFHDLILAAAGNRYLIQGVAQARRIPRIYDRTRHPRGHDDLLRLLSIDTLRQAVADHRRIFDALSEQQPDRAEFLMREHIFTNREQLRRNSAVAWDRVPADA